MKLTIPVLSSCLTLCLAVSLPAAADYLPGEAKAFPCTGCHGETGMKSAPGQPAIGGQPAEYLLSALLDYRSLRRINPAMQMLVWGMSESDLEDVAEYFALVGGEGNGAELR